MRTTLIPYAEGGAQLEGFAVPSANDPASGILYNPVAAERAWRATHNFLDEILHTPG